MSIKNLLNEPIIDAIIAKEYVSPTISLNDAQGFAVVSYCTSSTPANISFAPSARFTTSLVITNHGIETGLKARFTTTGVLPAPLSVDTDYWIIKVTADIIKVADSAANAASLVFITLTDDGTGTHSIDPVTEIAPNVSLEASIDDEIWAPIAAKFILSATPILIEHEVAFYSSVRFRFAVNAGQFYVNSKIMIKGYPL